MEHISQSGFSYTFDPQACRQCEGRCCTGEPGHVWINAREIDAVAGFLGLHAVDFVRDYLIRTDNRWSLAERRQDGQSVCIFYDFQRKGCKIYPARPAQCRTFPFWKYYLDRFAELLDECPGVKFGTNRNSPDSTTG